MKRFRAGQLVTWVECRASFFESPPRLAKGKRYRPRRRQGRIVDAAQGNVLVRIEDRYFDVVVDDGVFPLVAAHVAPVPEPRRRR